MKRATNTNFLQVQFRAAARELRAARLRTSRVQHKPTMGTMRETFVQQILRQYTPKRFEIASGVAVDSVGKESGQLDVTIFDALEAPTLLTRQQIHVIPIENLFGIVEVKSRLTTSALRHAVRQRASVRQLKPKYWWLGPPRAANIVAHNLFAYESEMSLPKVADFLQAEYAGVDAAEQLHTVYVLGEGVVLRGASVRQDPFATTSSKWEWIPEQFQHANFPEWNAMAWTYLSLVEFLSQEVHQRPRFTIDVYAPGSRSEALPVNRRLKTNRS